MARTVLDSRLAPWVAKIRPSFKSPRAAASCSGVNPSPIHNRSQPAQTDQMDKRSTTYTMHHVRTRLCTRAYPHMASRPISGKFLITVGQLMAFAYILPYVIQLSYVLQRTIRRIWIRPAIQKRNCGPGLGLPDSRMQRGPVCPRGAGYVSASCQISNKTRALAGASKTCSNAKSTRCFSSHAA